MRRFALSSSVRSSHWFAAVFAVFAVSEITMRARAQQRSERIGFRLYAIALEPTCFFPKGSSSSFKFASRRMSVHILCADCAMPERTERMRKSYFRVYVWPHTGRSALASKPQISAIRRDCVDTLAWSPSKSARYDACVPVVPTVPRNGRSAMVRASNFSSIAKSCSHSDARLPIVTSWAGW